VVHAHAASGHASEAPHGLPLFNASTLLAFITWFGAAGYLLTRTLDAPALLAAPVAVVVGALGAYLVALFLARVLAGERVMDPYDYRLAGTLGRISVSIPPDGVGEVLFSKAGLRRSEAARSASGGAIPRDTEVIITDYVQGIAVVEPWTDVLARPGIEVEPRPRAELPPRANA
jgi:hypothetical protein